MNRSTTFVGREDELARLETILSDARAGRGQLVLVSGEPGIGKTRLAAELAERARANAAVYWGRCWEGEGAPAFWPWVQIVRSYAATADRSELRADLGRAATDIARVIPEVAGDDSAGSRLSLGLQPEQERFRFFDGLTLFLKNASLRRPLVLVLDDVQWADTPSLLLLEFVARELDGAHLVIVATYRDLEVAGDHPLRRTLGSLVRDASCRRIPLGGLSSADVARYVELVAGHRPTPRSVDTLVERTEGNPFFLREIVEQLAAEGHLTEQRPLVRAALPNGVRDAIGRRIASLPLDCRRLLSLAAVIGRDFDLGILSALAGRDDSSGFAADLAPISDTLSPAQSAGIIHETGVATRVSFAHALIRESLYDTLPASERMRLHRRVAGLLERSYGAEANSHARELAYHFAAAGPVSADTGKALDYAERAADLAMHAYAYEDAVHSYRQALEILAQMPVRDHRRHCDLLLGQGEAEMRSGDVQGARERSLEAARISRQHGLADHFARAALGFGWHFDAGVVDRERIELLKEALEGLDPADSAQRARLMARLAKALYFVEGSYAWRAALGGEAVEMARRVGDPATLAFALTARLYALWVPDDTDVRIGLAAEVLRLAETCGDGELALQSRHWLVMDLIEAGKIEAARRHIDAHALEAARLRQPLYRWFASVWRASLDTITGDFGHAEQAIAQAHELGMRVEPENAQQVAMTQLFRLKLEQGRLDEFADAADAWRVEGGFEAAQACGRAWLFAEAERADALRRELGHIAHLGIANIPRDAGWLPALCALAASLTQESDAGLARSLYDLLLPFAGRVAAAGMQIVCFGSVSYHLARLASGLKEWSAADRHFSDALAMHTRLHARPLIARTRYDWAAMLAARDGPGDRERAHELVSEAARAAQELGMGSVLARCVALSARLDAADLDRKSEAPALDPDAAIDGTHADAPRRHAVLHQEGEYWTLSYDSQSWRLRDSKGIRYLRRLLAEPGRELHALDLVYEEGAGAHDATLPERGTREAGLEVLDATARSAYRHRLTELREELAEAEQFHDSGRSERARQEIDALTQQLAAAVGLGGRHRVAGSSAERARSTVTHRLRTAIGTIARHQPVLGDHLGRCIRTGVFCMFVPDGLRTIEWLLE